MNQKTVMFQDVSADELRSVVGGSFWSWLSGAIHWVADHIGLSGTDLGGNRAVVISVKGRF
jgi:hypothetical protein